ncbi:MAG: transposase [Malacoplasma sp.]|nr:transposase [Malacoplasma sp.]
MAFRYEQNIKGTIYVYVAESYWNSEKSQSRQRRTYIGKKDPTTGNLLPNQKYYEIYGEQPDNKVKNVNQNELQTIIKSVDYGNTYLMSKVAEKTGLVKVLQECFPKQWNEILSCAMHICSENEALYLCKEWAIKSNVESAPSSQRISELLKELDENSRMNFYKCWAELRAEVEYLALDISSVSSWSELINYVEYGYNRDKENLPQINLAMMFGEQSRLPVFSRVYPGSIKDVSTLIGMVSFIEQLELKKMHYVMDKGFYSSKAIELLLEKYIKFAIGVPFTIKFAKDSVEKAIDTIENPLNAIEVDGHIYYAATSTTTMYNRRVYIHVYYDQERHAQDTNRLFHKILKMENDLKNGKISKDNKEVQKYFSFQKTKDGSYNVHRKEDVMNEQIKTIGYFVILTNDIKDPTEVLKIYRTKDVVENSFDNINNDLDLERLRIHSDKAMEGRIFLGFISLIITSYIRNVMRQKNL